MKFYDNNGNLIWISATTNVPYDRFSGDSGMLFLTTTHDKSYIKDFGNALVFFNQTDTTKTYTLQNGSTIVCTNESALYKPIQLFDGWGDAYPHNGQMYINYMEIPASSGVYYQSTNIFWQPDGAGAMIMGVIVRILDPNDAHVDYYRLDWKRVSSWTSDQIQNHMDFFQGVTMLPDDDVSTTGGGDGGYDMTTTTDVGFPTLPSFSLLESEMIHGYALTTGQSTDLSSWFWGDTTLDQINQALKTHPMNGILSFGILPIDPPHAVSTRYINIGSVTSTSAQGYALTSEWTIIDFGKFKVPETWASFIDYTSTEIRVYLPYIGVETLDIDECMNSELHLKYYINCITGDCVAFIKVAKNNEGKNIAAVNSVLYNFTGNLLVQCPITGGDFSQRISSVVNGFLKSAEGAFASNPGQYFSGMADMILNKDKVSIKHAGAMNLIDGYMSVQFPYVILDRPSQSIPADFDKFNGRMSNITAALKQMQGYTEIESCRLDSVPATDTEKNEIMSLLKSGVIV